MKEIKEFKVLLEGNPSAEALVSQEPLSFWGGVDVASGAVLDIHHDLCGENVTGKVLCLPYDRGSCSGSGVLIEMVESGDCPGCHGLYRGRAGAGPWAADRPDDVWPQHCA